jgi:uncharacterized membrane protein YhaH (DUF805 family)
MKKENNIYNYKPPKSGNEEVSYFLTKGRITLKAFFLRLLLVVVLWLISHLIYTYYAKPLYDNLPKNEYEQVFDGNRMVETTFKAFQQFNCLYFPVALGIFLLIQTIKRMHDLNNSGWLLFVPLANIVFLFGCLVIEGTKGNNDYGVDPKPQKTVKYFDELKK